MNQPGSRHPFQRRTDRPHVRVRSADAAERGRQRGAALGAELPEALDLYLAFFSAAGLGGDTVRERALRTMASIEAWRPDVAAEFEGMAESASLEVWQVAALNARTELLAMARGGRPGECSTLTMTPSPDSGMSPRSPFGVQTWDWTEELNHYWHTQEIEGTPYAYGGITEHGILAKIGINEAGLSVFLNILSHRDDEASAVPVHIVVARLLAECATVAEATEFLSAAPVSGSTALTVMDTTECLCVELTPRGPSVLRPENGYLAHTNHFLDKRAAAGERGLYSPDSEARLDLVRQRAVAYRRAEKPDDLLEFLYSDSGQPHLCAVPEPDAPFGNRWRTLATVILDPGARAAHVMDGNPLERRTRSWREIRPGGQSH